MIDIPSEHLETVLAILNQHTPNCEVRAFGSRVNGAAKPYSDLDLVVLDATARKRTLKEMASVQEAFAASNLPFRTDVLDWFALSPEFQSVIEQKYEVMQPQHAIPTTVTQFRQLATHQPKIDRAALHDLLMNKMKLKREPVAVTYCDGEPPEGYAANRVPACAILHQAEQGKKVFVNTQHHDCLVGQYHLGLLPHEEAGSLICDGEYLTMAQGFFTPMAAKKNKQLSHTLPVGTIRGIAAAPLKDLADDVPMDLLCCITDAQRAMQIAGAASVREGIMPHGELGPSSCSSIFAAPFLLQNSVFALGEGGGRGFNHLNTSEMFVVLPAHHIHYLVEMFQNFWFKPDEMRRLIMPSHAREDKV